MAEDPTAQPAPCHQDVPCRRRFPDKAAHPTCVRPLRCHEQKPARSPQAYRTATLSCSFPSPTQTHRGTPGPHQKPPPLCTRAHGQGEQTCSSPSSGWSLMDLGDLKLSELPTSASAPGKRTPALPFSLGLCSGAAAPPAQCCSDNFSAWMLLQKRWPPSLDCFGCSMAGAGSTLTVPALN